MRYRGCSQKLSIRSVMCQSDGRVHGISPKERCANLWPRKIPRRANGLCLLGEDILGALVRLSEPDRRSGAQVEVLRIVRSMIVELDEQFLVHSVVHRAVLRLLKSCVGDDIQEQLDGRERLMGAAGNAVKTSPSEYEEDCE